MAVFGLGLTTFVTGVLVRRCELRWFDDVCNIGRPLVAWPCRPGVRLPETVVAFVGAGRASIETVIAFAGEKWVFLVHFSGAEVMPVSRLPCWGRAVVLLVSTSPRCCASCTKKFALRRCAIVKARKSSPCALTMAQNWRFQACWASFFAEESLEGPCWASFFAPIGPAPRSCRRRGALQAGCGGGFAALEAWPRRVVGVSGS